MQPFSQRAFDFFADTFSYPNELVWEYRFDERTGASSTCKRIPPPSYAHHCFVVARTARQFFFHATFDPSSAGVSEAAYRARTREIVSRSDCKPSPAPERIVIPGFANLREFSARHAEMLRANCGGSWQSYVQRGNWRMVVPFARSGQEKVARELEQSTRADRLPIIHVVTFPRLSINHAVMIFGAHAQGRAVSFDCYDPNICERPVRLEYEPVKRTFVFPRTHYFLGGPVNVYEIYRGLCF